MLSSGFNNAPISKILVGSLIASSIVVSIADLKYLFYINVVPHLWQYKQAWRLLVWQVRFVGPLHAKTGYSLAYLGMLHELDRSPLLRHDALPHASY